MINYTEKGIRLHEAIIDAGHSIAQVDGVWVSDDDIAVQAIIDSFDAVASYKQDKIEELKIEGVSRVNALLPAITNFDELIIIREQWLSIDPTARQATATFQQVIDLYSAGVSGVDQINALTTEQAVQAFDVVNDVAW